MSERPTAAEAVCARDDEELITYAHDGRTGYSKRQFVIDARTKPKPRRRDAILWKPFFRAKSEIRPPTARVSIKSDIK